jgi:Skp family chaperone for outer membrane proteins
MTTLGKILIFLNLVFSLLAGILIIQVYATRTSWKSAYDKLDAFYKVSEAANKALRSDMDDIKKKKDDEIKVVEKTRDALEADKKRLEGQILAVQNELQTEKAKFLDQNKNATVSNEELQRRQQETAALMDRLNKGAAALAEEQKKGKQLQDEKMQAVINFNSEHERNVRLLETFKQVSQKAELLEKKLASLGVSARDQLITRNPPPDDVEGVITDTDAKTGLVTISIGSDSGVNVGNTLEVFRIKPEPKYLGTIKILDAQAHQAVGKLTAAPRYGQLEKGDIVATKIMSTKR